MNSNIYIFSRAVRSGKTTALAEWLHEKKNAAGVLMPDEGEKRMLMNIVTGDLFELELDDATPTSLNVGRFHFDEEVFSTGKEILLNAINKQHDWIIVDEVGKLEIEQRSGFEPAVSQVISYCKQHDDAKLLLVVRDTLLEKVIKQYALEKAIVVTDLSQLK